MELSLSLQTHRDKHSSALVALVKVVVTGAKQDKEHTQVVKQGARAQKRQELVGIEPILLLYVELPDCYQTCCSPFPGRTAAFTSCPLHKSMVRLACRVMLNT